VEGDLLICEECSDSHGGKKRAFIALTECESFSNNNGFLVCDKLNNDPDLPKGTYVNTCGGCHVVNKVTLSCAECYDAAGEKHDTSVELSSCPTLTFTNNQGTLSCVEDRRPDVAEGLSLAQPGWDGLPAGSYRGSCGQCAIAAEILSCTCIDSAGGLRRSQSPVSSCHEFANSDGNLVCAPEEL
jgi:hypothetical protein